MSGECGSCEGKQYRLIAGQTWGKESVSIPRCKWNKNTNMDLKNGVKVNELD